MRPLTRTLTPAEVAELFDLAPGVVDALLDSGHVLCQFKGGEPRIPLAQLEEFFRERLIRVYRADVAREGEEPREALRVAGCELREPLPPQDHAPETRNPQPATDVPPPPQQQQQQVRPDAPDLRRLPRYIPRRQIDGIFDDVKFTILQISSTGLRIRHKEPLVPGTEAKLTFALLKPARSVMLRMRVVWTSLARSGEDTFSISGLRVIEHGERLAGAVESLRAAHELQPERRAQIRRADDHITTMLSTASDEEIALITAAMQKFAADPVEANRWYARGRFALSDEQVRRAAPQKPRDREEVLGLWEYLDRQVELEKVATVVAWTRGAN